MQIQLRSGIYKSRHIIIGIFSSLTLLILIMFLFFSSLKSSGIFEKLLDDVYNIEFDLLTLCEVETEDKSRTIDSVYLENILKTLETGVLKYNMIFSESGKITVNSLYFLLENKIAQGRKDSIVFTSVEYFEVQQGIKQLRQILFESSGDQKRALRILFILLLFMVVILLLLLISAAAGIDREKRRHQYHRELAKSISESENRIHNLLSSELHDDIGQMLVFLKLKLLGNDSGFNEDIDLIIDKVRNLSHDLKIPEFSNGKFAASVEGLISQFSTVSLIKVEYTLSDFHDELYPDYYPIIIFRVIQECLQNAVKHSKAKNIRINMVESAPFLIIRYKDDGVGMSSNNTVLRSIEDRAKLLNAEFGIDTGIDEGLRIVMKIPFVKEVE